MLINLEDIVTHDELIRQKHGYATRDIKRASENLRNTGIWKSLDIELPSPPDDPLKNTTNNQVQPQQSIKPPPQADPTPQTQHTTQHASSPPPPQHPPPAPEVHNSAVAPPPPPPPPIAPTPPPPPPLINGTFEIKTPSGSGNTNRYVIISIYATVLCILVCPNMEEPIISRPFLRPIIKSWS